MDRQRKTAASPPHWSGFVITHPEKVLFPDDGITKGDLAAYYEAIAPLMVPHLASRPITMERYPAGIGKKGFWQKDVSKGFPAWLKRVEVAEEGRRRPSSTRDRCAIAALDRQPEHDHAARLDITRAGSAAPRRRSLRSRSLARRPRGAPRGRGRAARRARRARASLLGQDLGLERVSHRHLAGRKDADAARRRGLPMRWPACWSSATRKS